MSHKVYRICLLIVVMLAIVAGIFCYLNYVKEKEDVTEGTLVQGNQDTENASFCKDVQEDFFYEEAEKDLFCEETENDLFCEEL